MPARNSISRFLVSLLILLSYCSTIPLLSTIHSDSLVVSGSNLDQAVKPGSSGLDGQDLHQVCEVCLRLNTAQPFFLQSQTPGSLLVESPVPLSGGSTFQLRPALTTKFGRAPPFC